MEYDGGSEDVLLPNAVTLTECFLKQGEQNWWIDPENGLMHHYHSSYCLAMSEDNKNVVMAECDKNMINQRWIWPLYHSWLPVDSVLT